ncbi:MAG: hypothetical protein K2O31_00540, partial [Clostridia bacterium]|nr:hypothetical protein [Clostridia bacterium]
MILANKKRISLIIVSIVIILAMTLGIFIGSVQEQTTQAAVISNADTISTDLLLPTRVDTNVGGKVFNTLALQELYAKLAGEDAEFTNVANEARKKKGTYANDSVKSIHSGMDSGDIRTANSNRNLVVKLGGKEWIVTALTTKDLSSDSDVILTLMLKDVAYNSKWGAWAPSDIKDFSATYPATMYSTSYIRAGLLNGTKQYTTDGSNLDDFTDTNLYPSGKYPFSIYTDTTEQGNITNFLVSPNQVLYQQNENLYDIAHVVRNNWYNAPNDSSKNAIPDSKWYSRVVDTSYGTHQIQDKTGYYDWGNDLIWLPSLSETGQNQLTGVVESGGLWNLDRNQRGVSTEQISWLRSGSHLNSTFAYFLDAAGNYRGVSVTSTSASAVSGVLGGSFAVRPALHLDLSLADESSAIPLTTPTDVTSTYNGEQQDYFNANGASWYNATAFSSSNADVKVEYSTSSGGTLSTPKPIEQGTYKVRLTIQNDEYIWLNGKMSQEIEFTINPKVLNVNFDPSTTPPKATPTNLCSRDSSLANSILRIRYTASGYDAFVPPTTTDIYVATVEIDTSVSNNYVLSRTYNVQYLGKPAIYGTSTQRYDGTELQYYIQFVNETDIGEIDITVPDEFSGIVDYADGEIKVTAAGEYWLNLNISKTDGTVMWSTRDTDEKRLEFEVTQAPMSLAIKPSNGANLEVTKGEKVAVKIDSMQKVYQDDVLNLDIVAVMKGLSSISRTVYSNLVINKNTAFPLDIDLETQGLAVADWIFELVPSGSNNANGNYDITLSNEPVILTVNAVDIENSLRWTFTRDGKEAAIYNQSTSDLTDEYYIPIEYNGKEVSVTARANDHT